MQISMPQIDISGTRMTRGMEIYEAGRITESLDGSFIVPSQTNSGLSYKVEDVYGHWVCTCPDFTYRPIETCKHVYAVQFKSALKQSISVQKPEIYASDALPCKFCNSLRVMKYGFKSDKQVFKCKDCARKFVPDSDFKKLKYNPELITITLDLYFKGISFRKIGDHLSQMYGVQIGSSTLYYWISKYITVLDDYVKTLTPKLSGNWHVDEMMIKVRGGVKLQKAEGQYKYLWNILDKESRFQLASEISVTRNEVDGMQVFQKAREIAKVIPKQITSDKYGSYPRAIERAFINDKDKPIHKRILSGACKKGSDGNQLAERLHNTIRERNKVQRGWKKDNTPLRNGQMIYYNFIRPHQTLKGQTPAQVASIDVVNGQKKWKELLSKALKNQATT